ncbi:antitoxin VbhA family protein [Rhizobium sp.]|uniref:antitoxin VbhA family protein n=1 Tax=Rhizobium sp. TaxID=391 RepID=UPI0028AA3A53
MTTEATKITREEQDRRAKLVRDAFRSNAQEGLKPNPACQPVFDAFIAGEIELSEMMPKVKAILGIS